MRRHATALTVLLLVACSDGGPGPADTSTDTGPDPDAVDTAGDTGTDTAVDTGTDTAIDTASDTATDTATDETTADGWIGAPCTGLSDCGAIDHERAACLPDSMEYPDGYCSITDCDTGGGDCPTGTSCISGGGGNFCMLDCTDDSECRMPCYHCMGVCMVNMAVGC